MPCSECGEDFTPQMRGQETCGTRRCKLARIKRRHCLGLAPERLPKDTMARRAKLRAAVRQSAGVV